MTSTSHLLPRCSDRYCLMDGFLHIDGVPWCRKHFKAAGGVL